MPSRFDQQFEATAAGPLDLEFSVSVRLVRGNSQSAAFDCAFSEIDDDVLEESAFGTQHHRRTWWAPVAACVIDSKAVAPRAGDYLLEVDTNERHELLPDDGDPAAAKQPSGDRYLVQTKRVRHA